MITLLQRVPLSCYETSCFSLYKAKILFLPVSIVLAALALLFIDMCALTFCVVVFQKFSQMAQGGGHRTLLYGHAVLLRHSYSGMVSDTDYI